MTQFIVVILTGIVALAGLYAYVQRYPLPTETYGEQSAAVVRAQNTPAPNAAPALIETSLDEGASAYGLALTPVAVVEDSRCALSTACVSAGTVRVATRVGDNWNGAVYDFTLSTPIRVAGRVATLVGVAPARESGRATSDATYRFTYRIEVP